MHEISIHSTAAADSVRQQNDRGTSSQAEDARDWSKPAIKLSGKDWPSRANRAVLAAFQAPRRALGILPRRPYGRDGASVVAAPGRHNPNEDPYVKACRQTRRESRFTSAPCRPTAFADQSNIIQGWEAEPRKDFEAGAHYRIATCARWHVSRGSDEVHRLATTLRPWLSGGRREKKARAEAQFRNKRWCSIIPNH